MRKQLQARFARLAQSAKVKGAAVGTVLMTGAVAAHAALDPAVDTAITTVSTDGVAMVGKGYALTAAIGGALILLGLFGKVLKRSAK